jgi:large subunit ribosomal protein L7/L12
MTDKKESAKPATSKSVEKLVDEVSKLSVLELSDLVNALQDKLGVSAMPMAQAAPATPTEEVSNDSAAASDAAASQTVVLTAIGENKISAIKAIREIDQNIGLKEAKDMTESLPTEILKDAKADDAKEAADKLKSAGCTVELK